MSRTISTIPTITLNEGVQLLDPTFTDGRPRQRSNGFLARNTVLQDTAIALNAKVHLGSSQREKNELAPEVSYKLQPDVHYLETHGALKFIKRVLVEEKRQVLLLDEYQEGSATVALAAMRGSFDNIWSSSQHAEKVTGYSLSRFIHRNYDYFWLRHPHRKSIVAIKLRLDDWRRPVRAHLSNFDNFDRFNHSFRANQLGDQRANGVPMQVIWFIFPWHNHSSHLAAYLVQFITSCSSVQEHGGVIFLTVTNDQRWAGFYDLPSFLALAESLGYAHFEDREFARVDLHRYGYLHRTYNHVHLIHDRVMPVSTTHILIKTT